ncbi:RNA polymerase sigma-70 factor (ECF subfamily) [Neolewinella xylanilytica]|uniref:RNA polymerase sigma-70 factor (ECF subfamily) n=1 Tax=Neolewinella xylanilytica TaxID=1514080 RepID=A0A2S6I1J7_9BACT|nr:sigma-70 family RNA polymerase sigma factor [Neolewinella xylanilytica]PPK85048.1 RNA polymerase sigma-70 factor (ECF subfamily) [Neolewinella xylanilytica]
MTLNREAHLARLRGGDPRSFRWIYNQDHAKVYGFCLKLLGSPTAAEEVTSDVFVRLWEKRSIIDPEQPIGPLLFKFTRDYAWNYLKRESRIQTKQAAYRSLQAASATAKVESDLDYEDYLRIAESAIRTLPSRQQEIFRMRYKSGLSNRQIATQLDLSESTVRVQLSRASHYLRELFRANPEMPIYLLSVMYLFC